MNKRRILGRTLRTRSVLLVGASFLAVTTAVGIAGAVVLAGRPAAGDPATARESQSLRASFVRRLQELHQSAQFAPARDSRFETLRVTSNGGEWQKATYRNEAGESCELLVVPGEGRGYGCSAPSSEPLVASWGSRQIPEIRDAAHAWDEAWVSGTAREPIARVQLVLTDCRILELPLTEGGAFLGVVGPAVMHAGINPHSVRGLNARGRVLATDVAEFAPATAASGDIGPPDVPARTSKCK